MGSLGPHSYDPGISETLLMWTTDIPKHSVEVDLDEGEAILEFENLGTVFDAFTVPNSFNTGHPMGFVSATIEKLRIQWKGPGSHTAHDSFSGPGFKANFVQNASATIELTVATPATKPPFTPAPQHGFRFVSNPASTVTHFAQIGQERNGALA